ncbi:MAG TPA: glycosyltransferase, partial [Methylomirabilota bacterium]|nr:glycosyltransferase [Methylomirabilota bacterium]
KADLERVGGLRGVRHVLAEDYVLGRRFEAAGLRVVVSPHVVTTRIETWTVGRFFARHVRWGQLRRRIAPLAYAGEPLLNPVPWCLALGAAGLGGASLGPLGPSALLAAALAGMVLKVASDGLLVHRLRGEPLAARHLVLLPVKDLLVVGVFAVAAVRRRVEWRGTVMRIGPGSRLLRVRKGRPAMRRKGPGWG